jgi:hypothetical protein
MPARKSRSRRYTHVLRTTSVIFSPHYFAQQTSSTPRAFASRGFCFEA